MNVTFREPLSLAALYYCARAVCVNELDAVLLTDFMRDRIDQPGVVRRVLDAIGAANTTRKDKQ